MIWKKTLPTVLLICLPACGAAPADPTATPASTDPPTASQPSAPRAATTTPATQESRLIRHKDGLYIQNVPREVLRNRLYYVLAEVPIPGTTDYPKLGVVRVTDQVGSSVQVVWWTLVDDDIERALKGEGLRVELVGQDLEKRVGRHWATFEVTPESRQGGPTLVLINLGADDGVQATDKYELFGEARANAINLSVDDFTPLGTCIVLPFEADRGRARCQVDVSDTAPKAGLGTKVQRGYARAATERGRK